MLLLLLIFLAAADQFGVSGDTATRRKGGTVEGIGSIYASKRAAFVGKSWADTSKDKAKSHFDGTPKTEAEKREAMGKVFGVDRAEGVAVDNTTDARTHGFEVAAAETFGRDEDDRWINRPDLSKTGPCPVCKPLHNTKRSHWSRFFPSGSPAHSGCVCEISYARNPVPATESVREAFDPSQPRGDDGKWIDDGSISLALASPEKAAELRAKVTKPEERAKLDTKLGDTDIGGLDFHVVKRGDFHIKTPRHDPKASIAYAARAHHLGGLVPETFVVDYDGERPQIAMKSINGREPTPAELDALDTAIRGRGIIPRDLTAKNAVVDSSGKAWAIDPGNFEVDFSHPSTANYAGVPKDKRVSGRSLSRLESSRTSPTGYRHQYD